MSVTRSPQARASTADRSGPSASPSGRGRELSAARSAKNDEFYTQLTDIENELQHYTEHFRGKTVLCNCDDPFESNFFRYFVLNFDLLGLKKLIATCYSGSPVAGEELTLFDVDGVSASDAQERKPYRLDITGIPDLDANGAVDLDDVRLLLQHDRNALRVLEGDGDFRSAECLEALAEADIVVTNPPFSLFREYVATLVREGKKFLILGNVNAVTAKDIFPLFRSNEMWFGPSISSGDREFRVPSSYPLNAAGSRVDEHGTKYIRVKGVRWFTNLDHSRRHQPLTLTGTFSPSRYPRYHNFDAIEVGKVADIPCDYAGPMGVPITFLDKFCPEQFRIVGISGELARPMSACANDHGHPRAGSGRFYVPSGDDGYRRLYDRIVVQRIGDM